MTMLSFYHLLVLFISLFVLGSAKVLASGDFAVKSASEAPAKKPKHGRITSLNALLDPKELVEDVNNQVLELIVKIAEQPATWRKIHRVLETLEANNAAYSQRVDINHEENWLTKRVDRLGDKRNDVPDDKPVPITTTDASFQSVERQFQRWKEALFAYETNDSNEDTLPHPQYLAGATDSALATETPKIRETTFVSTQEQPEKLKFERKFEERLSEIEDELRRLTKLSQMLPLQVNRLKQGKNFQQSKDKKTAIHKVESDEPKKNSSAHSKFAHPKFHYHRVENKELKGLDRLVGSEFWNRVASLKENGSIATVTKRNAIVAVSLAPVSSNVRQKDNENAHDGSMQATEPVRPVKLCKKKCHIGWRKNKQNQRKGAAHQTENVGAKVEKTRSISN